MHNYIFLPYFVKSSPFFVALSLAISIACLILAAAFKALAESCAHGKNRWSEHPTDFFGHLSWKRKWKYITYTETAGGKKHPLSLMPAPTTYYYKLFNLKYKERFPGSATIFVALSDGYHAAFSMMTSFIVLAVAIWTPWPILFFIGARCVWSVVFTIGYKCFSR